MVDIDKSVLDLVAFAVDHAVESIKTREPLIPFAVIEGSGKRELNRFVDNTQRESIIQAIKHIKSLSDFKVAVLVYDGYLTMNKKNMKQLW